MNDEQFNIDVKHQICIINMKNPIQCIIFDALQEYIGYCKKIWEKFAKLNGITKWEYEE